MQTADKLQSNVPAILRYGLAIAFVCMALGLSLALEVPFGNPFWFFFPVAVIAGTWFGGRGAGWVAAGLSTVVVLYYFIPPLRSFALKPEDVPFLLTFVACQVIANWVISWQRESQDALRQARDELELRVSERTAELKNANEALLSQMDEQRRTEEALQKGADGTRARRANHHNRRVNRIHRS